jgi:hypothetical protein
VRSPRFPYAGRPDAASSTSRPTEWTAGGGIAANEYRRLTDSSPSSRRSKRLRLVRRAPRPPDRGTRSRGVMSNG